jgi:hypothetical protein
MGEVYVIQRGEGLPLVEGGGSLMTSIYICDGF